MNFFDKNLFSDKLHKEYENILIENIPEISTCNHKNYYSLVEYYISSPQKYFTKEITDIFHQFFNDIIDNSDDLSLFFESIETNFYDLEQAIQGLESINEKNIHENILSDQDIELMYEISNTYLYEYLKLNDLVLLGLIKPIAFFLLKKENKGVNKLDIFNCVEVLKKHSKFKFLEKQYKHTLRNAIAHGGVKFSARNIEFKDKKKELNYSTTQFIKEFDAFLDMLNAICFDYRKFYLLYLYELENNHVKIPNSIMIKELKTKSEHFAWKILYNYDSIIQKGNQCNLYISTKLNSRSFMNLSAYYTAAYLEKLLPNTYDILFIHIKTKFKMPCWQIFDMKKLRAFINENIQDIVTDGTMLFEKKMFAKQKDYWILNKNLFLTKRLDYDKIIKNRYIKFHSKKTYNVIEKYCLVLNCNNIYDVKEYIRNNTKHLLKRAIKYKNTKSSIFSKEKILSTKYVRVLIYSLDFRERTFKNNSFMSNDDLMAVLQFNNSGQIKNILPAFGEREKNKHCDIFWSKNHPNIN